MKIGIIGNGVVGGCLLRWLGDRGHDVKVFDSNPARSRHTLEEVQACPLIFVCIFLPNNAVAFQEREIIWDVLNDAPSDTVVVIRSTLQPGTCDILQGMIPELKICFLPEFLTEAHSWEDFVHPAFHVFGGSPALAATVLHLLPRAKEVSVMTTRQAELVKLATAGFLSTKISWMNQLYDALGKADYKAVAAAMAKDTRIGTGFMDIFQDGYRGWGGKCFTKDTPCFAEASRMPLMQEVVKYNEELMNAKVKLRERPATFSSTVD